MAAITSKPIHTVAVKSISNSSMVGFALISMAYPFDPITPSCNGAQRTLSHLQEHRIPFIFLTNSGGATEKEQVALLGRRLSLEFNEIQHVQSHSPYYDLVSDLAEKNVLVLGGVGNKIRDLAHCYGFKHVVTSSDIVKAYPDIYPFLEITREHHEKHGVDELVRNKDGGLQIHSVLVWSSPRDWGLDLQLIVDLLLSEKGQICKRSKKNSDETLPNRGYLQDDQPSIHFCNPDLTWATAYDHPRAAQGMFKAALEGAWAAQTNGAKLLQTLTVGKPTSTTFKFGEEALLKHHFKLHGLNAKPLRTVYMIGDNPMSDIFGTNTFEGKDGTKWKSLLVETGVHRKGEMPAVTPHFTLENVECAVEWAMMNEGLDWYETSERFNKNSADRIDATPQTAINPTLPS